MPDRFNSMNAGKYLKPYQGLKRPTCLAAQTYRDCKSRKIPKTLSGIETFERDILGMGGEAGKYLKPYQGLKQYEHLAPEVDSGRKIPKTLSGIETSITSSPATWL